MKTIFINNLILLRKKIIVSIKASHALIAYAFLSSQFFVFKFYVFDNGYFVYHSHSVFFPSMLSTCYFVFQEFVCSVFFIYPLAIVIIEFTSPFTIMSYTKRFINVIHKTQDSHNEVKIFSGVVTSDLATQRIPLSPSIIIQFLCNSIYKKFLCRYYLFFSICTTHYIICNFSPYLFLSVIYMLDEFLHKVSPKVLTFKCFIRPNIIKGQESHFSINKKLWYVILYMYPLLFCSLKVMHIICVNIMLFNAMYYIKGYKSIIQLKRDSFREVGVYNYIVGKRSTRQNVPNIYSRGLFLSSCIYTKVSRHSIYKISVCNFSTFTSSMEYKKYLTGAFYTNPFIWLFIADDLFKECAKNTISRYRYLIKIPQGLNEIMGALLNNKSSTNTTLNKWTKEYVDIIYALSHDTMEFNFPLEDNEKSHLWLEFFCFMLRLKLQTQPSFDTYNYNIFSNDSELQVIANYINAKANILNDPLYDINYFVNIIHDTFPNDQNIEKWHGIIKEILSKLKNYIKTRKLTLKPSQAIISIILALIWLNGFATFKSLQGVKEYIERNIRLYEHTTLEFLLKENRYFLYLLENTSVKIHGRALDQYTLFDNIKEREELENHIIKPYISEKSSIEDLLKVFEIFDKDLMYTYLSDNNKVYATGYEPLIVKEVESRVWCGYRKLAQKEYRDNVDLEKKVYEDELRLHKLRLTLPPMWKAFEIKRYNFLKKFLVVFLSQLKEIMTTFDLKLEDIQRNEIIQFKHIIESATWKSLQCNGDIFDSDIDTYMRHKEKIKHLKYSKNKDENEKNAGFYIKMLDVGLSVYTHGENFYYEIYDILHFTQRFINSNKRFASKVDEYITEVVCYRIYNTFQKYFNVIESYAKDIAISSLEEKDKVFYHSDRIEFLNQVTLRQLCERKELFHSIYTFSLFNKTESTKKHVIMKNSFKYFAQCNIDIDIEYNSVLDSNMNPLMKVIKSMRNIITYNKIPMKLGKQMEYFISFSAILFNAIYEHNFKGPITNESSLRSPKSIQRLLSEVIYFSDATITLQILRPNVNETNIARHLILCDKDICKALTPVIKGILDLLDYHDMITKENAELTISRVLLKIMQKTLKYLDYKGMDIIILCFIQWLCWDLEKVNATIDGNEILLDKLVIIKPSSMQEPEKYTLNIYDIMESLYDLEQKVSSLNINLDEFYYDIVDTYQDKYLSKFIYGNTTMHDPKDIPVNDKESPLMPLLKYYNIIKLDLPTHYQKYTINYELLEEIESMFNEITFFDHVLLTNSTLTEMEGYFARRHILFGKCKTTSQFTNTINEEVFAYTFLPSDPEKKIIFGVITNNYTLISYYKDPEEKNKAVYFPREKLYLSSFDNPNSSGNRLMFLKNFIIIDSTEIENVNFNSDIYNYYLYTNKESGKMTIIDKIIINFKAYRRNKPDGVISRKNIHMDINTLERYISYIRQHNNRYRAASEKQQMGSYFVYKYRNWIKEYETLVLAKIQRYHEEMSQYRENNRTFVYGNSTLTNQQQLYFFLFLFHDKNASKTLPIKLVSEVVSSFANEYNAKTLKYSNSKIDILFEEFSRLRKFPNTCNDRIFRILTQYILRLQERLEVSNISPSNIIPQNETPLK